MTGTTADVSEIRAKLRDAVTSSGMTHEKVGVAMGFSPACARQAVSRLLSHNEYDPRLSTLLALAKALKKPLSELI